MRCRCIRTDTLLRYAIENPGEPIECPDHAETDDGRDAGPEAIALNDGDALAAAIAGRLGIPTATTTTEL